MTKYFKKNSKNPILGLWGHFGLFYANLGKNEFSWEKGSVSF